MKYSENIHGSVILSVMRQLFPLLVLALVVAGFFYYTLFPSIDLPAPTAIAPVTTVPTPEDDLVPKEPLVGTSTIYELLERGEQLECQVMYTSSTTITGSLFTVEGNARGDFIVSTPDLLGQMVSSVIVRDGKVWQWVTLDGDTFGSVSDWIADADALERIVAPLGFNTPVVYDCSPWESLDRTIYQPPTDILFGDVNDAQFEDGLIF